MADVQPCPDLLLPKSSPPSFSSPRPPLDPIISCPPEVSGRNIADIVQYYLSEEYAWRATECLPIEEHIRSRPDLHAPASTASLQTAFSIVFATQFCPVLNGYYESLHPADSPTCSGFEDLDVATVCANIVDQLYSAASQLVRRAVGTRRFGGPGTGGRGRIGGGSGGDRGTERGRGGGGRRGRGGGGGGGGSIRRRLPDTPLNLFDLIPRTYIPVAKHHTPQHPDQSTAQKKQRRLLCRSQAIAFANAIEDLPLAFDLPEFTYTGGEDDPIPAGAGVLYHATRLSRLNGFARAGVNPIPFRHPNFFSSAASFNLANSAEQAVSHVLHAGPTLRLAGSDLLVDPILVLAFKMDIATIISAAGTGYVDMGEPGELLNELDSEWIAANWAAKGNNEILQIEHDWIVGPFLVPLTGGRYLISECVSGTPPVHVAAVSGDAFRVLNNSLVGIFVETEPGFDF